MTPYNYFGSKHALIANDILALTDHFELSLFNFQPSESYLMSQQ